MKILYHHRTLGNGAEGIHIREMVDAFRSLGHEVLVIGPAADGNRAASTRKQSWFSVLKKWVKGPAFECLELGYNLLGYAHALKEVKAFAPDFIYDRYITYNYALVKAGLKSKVPVFLEVNAPLAYERAHEPDEKLYFKRLAYLLEKKICSQAFKTITVSTPLKRYLQTLGVPPDKIVVMPNGVDPTKFYPTEKPAGLMESMGLSGQSIVVGFTGILRPWHGIDILVDAFGQLHRKFPEAVLLLVGDGSIRPEVEKRAEQAGCIGALRITGYLPHAKVKEYIGLFDIAVSPKTTFYASPMKIPEYMAMGKPVVAPDTENIRDLIHNGRTGLLFKGEDSDDLGRALTLLAGDPSKRTTMGKNGISEIRQRLNWVNNAKRIIDIHDREW